MYTYIVNSVGWGRFFWSFYVCYVEAIESSQQSTLLQWQRCFFHKRKALGSPDLLFDCAVWLKERVEWTRFYIAIKTWGVAALMTTATSYLVTTYIFILIGLFSKTFLCLLWALVINTLQCIFICGVFTFFLLIFIYFDILLTSRLFLRVHLLMYWWYEPPDHKNFAYSKFTLCLLDIVDKIFYLCYCHSLYVIMCLYVPYLYPFIWFYRI